MSGGFEPLFALGDRAVPLGLHLDVHAGETHGPVAFSGKVVAAPLTRHREGPGRSAARDHGAEVPGHGV